MRQAISTTTTRQARPPVTTAKTALLAAATSPDSSAPSSLEALMKTELTPVTRPRRLSGVLTWIIV